MYGLINQLPFDHEAKYRAHTFCYILLHHGLGNKIVLFCYTYDILQ
jgi:hypothetical protein